MAIRIRFNDFPLDSPIGTNTSGDFAETWSWLESEFEIGAIESGEWVLKALPNDNAPVLMSGAVVFDTDGTVNTANISNNGEPIPRGVNFYQVRVIYKNGFRDVWFQSTFNAQRGLL